MSKRCYSYLEKSPKNQNNCLSPSDCDQSTTTPRPYDPDESDFASVSPPVSPSVSPPELRKTRAPVCLSKEQDEEVKTYTMLWIHKEWS
jgi:hypothetical protein